MANVYKDFQLKEKLSAYAVASLGLAQLKSSGWQGNATRQYGSSTDTQLSYSVGSMSDFDGTVLFKPVLVTLFSLWTARVAVEMLHTLKILSFEKTLR